MLSTKTRGRRHLCLLALAALVSGSASLDIMSRPSREEAYRANNRGVALLEQFQHEEAAAAFRKALRIDPGLSLARVNLAIALLNLARLGEAREQALSAAAVLPQAPQAHYVLALAARGLGAPAEAEPALRRVLQLDAQDVGARVNLGQVLVQQGRLSEAVVELKTALEADPNNATAAYNLGLALLRSGQAEEGERVMARFRELREAPYATFLGQSYPEQGRYAEAIASTGAEPELVEASPPSARFVDATARWLKKPGPAVPLSQAERKGEGRVTLFDLDRDGDLDAVNAGPEGVRVLVNEGRALADATQRLGIVQPSAARGVVAGDLDNDGHADLLVLQASGPRLLRNDGVRLVDVTAVSALPPEPARAAALADLDHDGDLDVFLTGLTPRSEAMAAVPPHRLLQNDGAARFKDVTAAAGLAASSAPGLALVATDFDNRRDMDVLVVTEQGVPLLLQNLRDGRFRDVAGQVGLDRAQRLRSVAAGDVNKDGYTDFFLGTESGPGLLAQSDGRGRWVVEPAPADTAGARQAMFLDYDADGLLDLVLLAGEDLRVLRGLAARGWRDVSAAALGRVGGGLSSFAAGDLDGDGDTDLLARETSGALRVLLSQGGSGRTLRVRLAGRVSNRSAVGAKVEMRAGSLRQKLETYASTPAAAPADVVFGLGARAGADAVRVLWPSGTLQAELVAGQGGERSPAELLVTELDRKPSSCPYLFAWNGSRFEFATDFMGGGEMGYWQGPGRFNQPDPDEYVRLRDDQLRPREGRYELRVTNELEEALFVDGLSLLAVAHPAEVEVFPDEGLRSTPPPFRLQAVRELRPPLAAVDDHGHDVRARLARLDRVFVDDFTLHRIRGYAEQHTLVLDLGPDAGEDSVLLLTGWTDYAFSSDNVAAQQAGLVMAPPRLETEEAPGVWRMVVEEVGIPVGRPQTLVVPLAGRWRSALRRVRIVTNMRIYWDQAQVGTSAALPLHPQRLEPVRAELRERGFSAPVSADGREPFGYDHGRVSSSSPWKTFPGRYTRTGDVRELLGPGDDVFVVSRPGDEIALSFDADALAPLPAGWTRTWLFFADGFSKEMDINSATPHTLEPPPFHGMRSYPYPPSQRPALDPQRQALVESYNTRQVRSPFAALDLVTGERP